MTQVIHDDLGHGQVIFNNENVRVHGPSLRTLAVIKNCRPLIQASTSDISSDCHKFQASAHGKPQRLQNIEFSIL